MLKRAEIYANTYRDLSHLRTHIAAFIEQYSNTITGRDCIQHWAIVRRKSSSVRWREALHPVPRPLRSFKNFLAEGGSRVI